MATQHYGVFTLLDYSEEKSPFKFYNGAVTATSISGYLTDFNQLRTAVDNFTLGTLSSEMWVGDNTVLSQVPPTDPDAQRERKALIVYQGNTSNKTYTASIPTARTKDGTGASLLLPGTDKYDLAAPLVAALVTEFQTVARTPDSDTESVTVLEIRLVGRNI